MCRSIVPAPLQNITQKVNYFINFCHVKGGIMLSSFSSVSLAPACNSNLSLCQGYYCICVRVSSEPSFWWTQIFFAPNVFLHPKWIKPKIISGPISFLSKTLSDPYFFGNQVSFNPKFFWSTFFLTQFFFGPNQNFSGP